MKALRTSIILAAACGFAATAYPDDKNETPVRTSRRLTVDWRTEFQRIDNFGASDCWYIQYAGLWADESRNRLADLLFSTEVGAGLSSWRFNIGAGINRERIAAPSRTVETFETAPGEYDWTRQEGTRWFLGAAKARGVDQFVAFACSPPARMTRNGFTNCTKGLGSTNLKAGMEDEFAKYLVDIVKHFRDNEDESQRVAINWISPINEPQWDWDGGIQEGCRAGNDDIKAVARALAAEIERQGLDANILLIEGGILDSMYLENRGMARKYGQTYGDYIDVLCGDPSINGGLGRTIACHSHWTGGPDRKLVMRREKLRAKLDEYPDWTYWQTEYCIMEGGRDLTMQSALRVAKVIHADLTIANASAWQWWLGFSPNNYKDGLIYSDWSDPGDPEIVFPSKILWIMGNYSRFVRPGSTRIALAGVDQVHGLAGSAYKSPDEESIALVLINTTESALTVKKIKISGLPKGARIEEWTPYVTSDREGDDLKAYPALPANAKYDVPPRSVVTLTGRLDR
ncbi:MAG: glycoside hydrolase family 30 protein [bacterium]|nr:glycoside hydrolase family 30 protein [bacterium]